MIRRGVRGFLSLIHLSVCIFVLDYYWGCARGFGRGTLYMKWGQGNLRFATMRLRGEKDEKKEKKRKKIKYKI